MKLLRIFLLMLMVLVVLMMAACPGSYDSKRRSSAHRQFYNARQQHEKAPTRETQQAMAVAQERLEKAKGLDRRDILYGEGFMLGILSVLIYAFIRAGKRVQKLSAA